MDPSVKYFIVLSLVCWARCCIADLPVKLSSGRLRGTNGSCPSDHQLLTQRQDATKETIENLHSTVLPIIQERYTACGCSQRDSSWYRIAYLNMNDPNENCPSNWNTIFTPVRACGKRTTTPGPTCNAVSYPSNGRSYSQVCGRMIGLQRGTPNAFNNSVVNPPGSVTIDDAYIDGVSLTRGSPREHVWSFVNGYFEDVAGIPEDYRSYVCPCTYAGWPYQVPSFVGNDYFCATGNRGANGSETMFYLDDPLWDGSGCGLTSTCCQFNDPPWFCTTLSSSSSADLEIRICGDQEEYNENTYITFMEIYVK